MPIGGTRQTTKDMGRSYRKSPLSGYAQAFAECAESILQEEGYDIFEEPQKVYRRQASNESMRKFFTENWYDPNNTLLDAIDQQDLDEQADLQFDNDVQAMYEHAAPAEYNPIVGMALPIHKLILMNNVFDKGVA